MTNTDKLTPGLVARKLNWWLWLAGPIVVAAVVVHSKLVDRPAHFKTWMEAIAPWMLLAPTVLYAIRSAVTRNPLYIILTVLSACLLWREWHEFGSHRGIYVALALLAVWAWLWRARLADTLFDWRHTSWLAVTLAAYFLAQAVSKRVFKFIPGEKALHVNLEESVETLSHLLLIITSLVGNWRRFGAADSAAPQAQEQPAASQ